MRNLGPHFTWLAPQAGALLALAGVLIGAAPDARADDGKRTSSLAWVRLEGAEACIAGGALAVRIEERLRRKVFVSPSDADISVEGSIGPAPRSAGSGFRAVLRVTSRDGKVLGTREVETRSAHCDAIDDKLALIVSVLIDPDAPEGDAPPGDAPAPLPPPPTVVERERIVVVHDAPEPAPPSRDDRWRVDVTAAGSALFGQQPGVGFGFAPSLVVRPPHFWGVLAGGAFGASTTTDPVRGAKADVSLASGVLALCPIAFERGRVEITGCAGAVVGALFGQGIGFDTTNRTSSLFGGPAALGRLELAVAGPLVAHLGVGLLVPVTRAEVGYGSAGGEGTLFRTSAVAGSGELGLGLKFP